MKGSFTSATPPPLTAITTTNIQALFQNFVPFITFSIETELKFTPYTSGGKNFHKVKCKTVCIKILPLGKCVSQKDNFENNIN
jgi:hypothetical protein